MNFEIREIPLSSQYFRNKVELFLRSYQLRMDEVDYFAGIYDSDESLIGCGGFKVNTIKCLAITNSLRGEGLALQLVSHLTNKVLANGNDNVRVYTKPENEHLFKSLGFVIVGETDKAIFMESNPRSLKDYIQYLNQNKCSQNSRSGVIVMNCNPLTKGHLYLIDKACEQVDYLFVIPLDENPTNLFSLDDRICMLSQELNSRNRLRLLQPSHYAISADTFPTYFIKELSEASETQMLLDLNIFANHIAPALNVAVRFVGSEPKDKMTAQYNALMKKVLPESGIRVVEIERKATSDGLPISASEIRKSINTGVASCALLTAAESAIPFILAKTATTSLTKELTTTPKPGLIDSHDSGAHRDMDFKLMEMSIKTLYPYFVEIARLSASSRLPETNELKDIGLKAENAMFNTTGGINTHKGAIFSLGLAVASMSQLLSNNKKLTIDNISDTIKDIAKGFIKSTTTHGGQVRQKYGVGGALELALTGYRKLFESWLPYYAKILKEDDAEVRLLLKIMTEIDDTNIYYRGGSSAVEFAKSRAQEILNDFSTEKVRLMNEEFIHQNISPGGAADMLALTIFFNSITTINNNQKSITNG